MVFSFIPKKSRGWVKAFKKFFIFMNNYLKKRLIPVILIKEGNVVQSIKFSEYKIIGKPVETISRLNKFGSDEIILLDISKKRIYKQ